MNKTITTVHLYSNCKTTKYSDANIITVNDCNITSGQKKATPQVVPFY